LTVVLASVFGTNYASPSSVGAMFGSDGSASTATAETLPRSIYETVERGTPYTVDYRIFIGKCADPCFKNCALSLKNKAKKL
jgi:hypothetical protein